jgi:hypothetical protein
MRGSTTSHGRTFDANRHDFKADYSTTMIKQTKAQASEASWKVMKHRHQIWLDRKAAVRKHKTGTVVVGFR